MQLTEAMPELPEVETLRRDLCATVLGRRITGVRVLGARSVRRHASAGDLAARLEGRTIAGVGRLGKYLLVRVDAEPVLVVHLGMSGQLLLARSGAVAPAHTHVELGLDGGTVLRFVDPRTFGELFLGTPDGAGSVTQLAHLGPDAFDPPLAAERFSAIVRVRRTMLKPLLLDQRFLAGLGNIYADETLFLARLRPDRSAASLRRVDALRLHAAIGEILEAAVRLRGSSLADRQYRDMAGGIGGYQDEHRVYDREGEPCLRCGAPIARVRSGGRSTHFCRRCQR